MHPAAKVFLYLVVAGSVAVSFSWTAFALFEVDSSSRLNSIANRIMSGDAYTGSMPSDAELAAAEAHSPCNALAVRSAAIIRLRAYEDAVSQAGVKGADVQMAALRRSADRALACVPTESFLWFVRYWIGLTDGKSAAEQLDSLKMSYRLGPNEGWIALRRNVFALAIYNILPSDLQVLVLAEFASLVNSGFLKQALTNLKGPGWPLREALLSELLGTKLAMRQYFYKMLRADGFDLEIPGVERREFRSWN